MKFLGNGGMAEAEELRGQQGTDQFLSNAIGLNNTYRAFVPIISDGRGGHTVAAATVVGRNLDFDCLGSSFILIEYDVNDLGQVRDITGLDRLARISGVLYEASYRRSVAREQREAKAEAEEMNRAVDEGALSIKLNELDLAYHGGVVNGQKVRPTKKQCIGPVSVTAITNLSIVKINPDGMPEKVSPQRVALVLSSTKINQLKSGLKKMTQEDIDRGFLEFNYVYEGADKPAAGRDAKFEYIEPDRWLQKTTPLWHGEYGTEIKNRLLYTQEQIAAKNRNVSFTLEVNDIVMRFKDYISKQSLLMPYIDTTASLTKNAAEDLLNYEVVNGFESLREQLVKLASEDKEADDQAVTGKEGGEIVNASDQIEAMEKVGAEAYDNMAGIEEEDEKPGML